MVRCGAFCTVVLFAGIRVPRLAGGSRNDMSATKANFLSPSPNIFHLGSQFKTEISRKLRPPRNKEAQNEKTFPGFLAHGRGFSAGFLETEVVVAGVSGNGSYCCRGFWKRKLLLPWFLETEVIVAVVSGNGSYCCRGF